MKRIKSLEQFTSTLPYSSEIFGVYQPLLGWWSGRILKRIEAGYGISKKLAFKKAFSSMQSRIQVDERRGNDRSNILVVRRIEQAGIKQTMVGQGSFLFDAIESQLPARDQYRQAVWQELLSEENLARQLDGVLQNKFADVYENEEILRQLGGLDKASNAVVDQAIKESKVAGFLSTLANSKQYDYLKDMFYGSKTDIVASLHDPKHSNPLEHIDPHNDLGRVVISPISLVHLFRQYFFEFDTFLGTPVEHVWLSPGSSVELVEISTRKTIVEKSFQSELEFETVIETDSEESDEISDAVKQENRTNTKFGFNTDVKQSWVSGSASASTSLNLDNTQQQAREFAHKHMRSQTERLSSKIRRNYKSNFKTITETTDTSSKRYSLTNTTDKLINYEMRRKMRQVGVQVQDIGSYLCWQTFVDDPGKQLGVAKLVHATASAELSGLQQPDAIENPEHIVSEMPVDIRFNPVGDDTVDEDMDEEYVEGIEVDLDPNEGDPESIEWKFPGNSAVCESPGFELDYLSYDSQGNDIQLEFENIKQPEESKVTFDILVPRVNFRGKSPLRVVVKVHWRPTEQMLNKIKGEHDKKVQDYSRAAQFEFQKAYAKAAKERVELASKLKSRPFEDLRDEERIVVYRALIQDMLTKDLPLEDDRSRHVVAELLNTIFDVDKMLYFVAPEWWKPRIHQSDQDLGTESLPSAGQTQTGTGKKQGVLYKALQKDQYYKKPLSPIKGGRRLPGLENVGWGGFEEIGRDNYFVSEDSDPAKMGSSLGWLLQLDGDDMRNAFLNAPWVKAVIPIRPGKEKAAFNWLKRVGVEGSGGLGSEYIAAAQELDQIPHTGNKVTIEDAINHLCDQIRDKHQDSMQVGRYPPEEINDDNRVSATPVDKVYEHGFYPNQDGFKIDVNNPFEIYDQWLEVLPTDQIVPVEVKYDPITGRQIPAE